MIKTYFNGKAAVWDETAAEKDTGKLRELAACLDMEPGSTVLDVGTGTGVFLPHILNIIGESGKLVCVELAERMLQRCQAKGFEGNIEYICSNITDTRLPDDVFDCVVCYSSFPHFQDKPGALREIHRMLTPGGRLFICHSAGRQTINGIHLRIPEVSDDLIPDENQMRQLLQETGFTEISIYDGGDRYLARAVKLII